MLALEVLSPSTEALDRGQKFRYYRRIDTLKEYVLIDPDRVAVECYRLSDQGIWEFTKKLGLKPRPLAKRRATF